MKIQLALNCDLPALLRCMTLPRASTPAIRRRLASSLPETTSSQRNLMAREGTVSSIPEWLALHGTLGISYSKTEWRELPVMWQELLASGALKLFLVEDRNQRLGSRIVSCCSALFITDLFCCELKSGVAPFLGIELVRRFMSHALPVLTRNEIARTNATNGLNLVFCFDGPERSYFPGERYLPIREKRHEALQLVIGGYQIKEFLANPVGALAYQEMIDAGAKRRCDDFRRGFNGVAETPLPSRLVGLTRKEAEAHPGSQLAGLFVHTPPRFQFSPSEQTLLQYALTGETGEDLAASLSLSPWTVKKRWQAVYERVARVDKELLPPRTGKRAPSGSRGSESRRRLLNYLRQHPEELRPFRIDSQPSQSIH